MNNQEILEKAIQKAIDGGWNAEIRIKPGGQRSLYVGGWEDATASYHGLDFPGDYNIIFNHDFAKALWGEDEHGTQDYYSPKHNEYSGSTWLKAWQYHLQMMVIADNPIQYLRDNI